MQCFKLLVLSVVIFFFLSNHNIVDCITEQCRTFLCVYHVYLSVLQNDLSLAFDSVLNLAFDSIQGCSHGSTGGGTEENGLPRRETAELGVRLPSSCWPGTHFAHHGTPPRPVLPSAASAHVQCSHQRGFQIGRCLFIRYLLLLILLELPHLWRQRQCWPLRWERGWALEAMSRAYPVEWSSIIPASERRWHQAWAVLCLGGSRGNGLELLKDFFPKEVALVRGGVGDQKMAGTLCTHSGEIMLAYSFLWLSLRLLPCIHSV